MTTNFLINEFELKPDQQILIEASAGSGKTHTIEHLFTKLVVEQGLGVERILVTTFTKAAAAELRDRILKRLVEQKHALIAQKNSLDEKKWQTLHNRLDLSLQNYQQASIGTVHSIFMQWLSNFALEAQGYFSTKLTEIDAILQESCADFWRVHTSHPNPDYVACFFQLFKTPTVALQAIQPFLAFVELKIIRNSKLSTQAAFEQLAQSHQALVRSFPQQATDLMQCIEQHRQDFGASYKAGKLKEWTANVQQMLHSQSLAECFQEISGNKAIIQKFTSEALHQKSPNFKHSLVDLVDNFLACSQQFTQAFYTLLLDHAKTTFAEKKQQGQTTYQDVLIDVYAATQKDRFLAKVSQKYQAVLVDEFQDTDPLQYKILEKLFFNRQTRIYFVGDPKQAIYNFRGADVFAYLKAKQAMPQTAVYNLAQNWRADADLVEAINEIFSQQPAPFLTYPKISFEPAKAGRSEKRSLKIKGQTPAPLQLAVVAGQSTVSQVEQEILKHCTQTIAELLNLSQKGLAKIADRPVLPEDIAVLVRKNQQALDVQMELGKLQVMGALVSRSSVFASEQFQELLLFAKAIQPNDKARWLEQALITSIGGFTGEQIYQMQHQQPETRQEQMKHFQDYQQAWQDKGFSWMMEKVFQERKLRPRLLQQSLGRQKLTNLIQALELCQQAEYNQRLNPNQLVEWMEGRLNYPENAEEESLKLPIDQDTVKISTVHASKGLEYPIVFCPFLWKKSGFKIKFPIFHDSENQAVLDLGNQKKHQDLARQESTAESLRLLYVGLTRAQHGCWLYTKAPKPNAKKEAKPNIVDQLLFGTVAEDEEAYHQLFKDSKNIQVSFVENDQPAQAYKPTNKNINPKLEFKRVLKINSRLESFTSLSTRGKKTAEDIFPESKEPTENVQSTELAGGAHVGQCFHQILAELNFQLPVSQQPHILKTLEQFDLVAKWQELALDWLPKVQQALLPGPKPFSLAEVDPQKMIVEMEFNYTFSADAYQQWAALFQKPLAWANKLHTEKFNGYMRGYIDLWFEHQGLFYVLDWKTSRIDTGYATESLKTYMHKQAFGLQYQIYAEALQRYLGLRIKNYTPKLFGGVFYVFLRGVALGKNEGIFFDDFQDKPLVKPD